MRKLHWFVYPLILAVVLVMTSKLSRTQTVLHYTDTTKSLSERWTGAQKEASKKGFTRGYWIGYSITRLMGEHSMIGCYYSDQKRNRPSLGELITGMRKEYDLSGYDLSDLSSAEGFINYDEEKKPRHMIKKEIGILFHFYNNNDDEFDNLRVSNLSLHVDLQDDPLIWIGPADHAESISFLESLYKNVKNREAKKQLITAIGLHDPSKPVIEFLRDVLLSSESVEVRKESAFWLSQTQADEARNILLESAQHDNSMEVREQSIFAISQMDGEASIDDLITLAKHHPDTETRKKAIFWLSQKASDKAHTAIKDFVYKDADSEVQKSALFALTQVDNGNDVDDIITVAKSHPNPKVRKEAIFWLGQSENPKAIDALIELVKK